MRPSLTLIRGVLIVIATVMVVLIVGYLFQMTWATSLWPWQDGRLSYLFLASILAAIAAPIIWVCASGEWGALAGSTLFPLVASAGMSIYLLQKSLAENQQNALFQIVVLGMTVVFSLAIFFWGRRFTLRDSRPSPTPVRVSFVIFAIVLILAGGLLILKVPNIMPWAISSDSSVMFGWIFLGAATSYVFGALRPMWNFARAPLLGFLLYDIVLGAPLISHFTNVLPEHQLSLIIYTVVVIYSGLLAAYYLFIYRRTRSWRIQESS